MFNFIDTTVESSSAKNARFPFPTNPEKGVTVNLTKYSFDDEKDTAIFEFTAENGATTLKKMKSPAVNSKGEPSSDKYIAAMGKFVSDLAKYMGIKKALSGSVSTWKEYTDAYFIDLDYSTLKQIRVKAAYAKGVQEYTPSDFEGKSEEEIKKIWTPYVNIIGNMFWANMIDSTYKFKFDDTDHLDFELVEKVIIPSDDDDLPFAPSLEIPEEDLF